MKRVLCPLIVALLLAAGLVASAVPPLPQVPTEWVTDTAGFLSETTRQELDARLQAYERASGHQVLVWVGKTTGETPIEDWAVRVFEAWRVGRKGMDDGLVMFIMADDRTIRIEVGYGLEGQVPDALASRIIREVMIPRIQAGDRDGAVTAGVDQLITAMGGEDTRSGNPPATPPPLGLFEKIGLGLLVIVVILLTIRYPSLMLYILSRLLSRGGGGGNGGFSGGGGRSGGGGATGKW